MCKPTPSLVLATPSRKGPSTAYTCATSTTSKVAINTRAEYEAREESEDMPEEVIRASVHYFNAEWEVDKLCAAVEGLWIASLKADTGEIL